MTANAQLFVHHQAHVRTINIYIIIKNTKSWCLLHNLQSVLRHRCITDTRNLSPDLFSSNNTVVLEPLNSQIVRCSLTLQIHCTPKTSIHTSYLMLPTANSNTDVFLECHVSHSPTLHLVQARVRRSQVVDRVGRNIHPVNKRTLVFQGLHIRYCDVLGPRLRCVPQNYLLLTNTSGDQAEVSLLRELEGIKALFFQDGEELLCLDSADENNQQKGELCDCSHSAQRSREYGEKTLQASWSCSRGTRGFFISSLKEIRINIK